MKHLLAVLLCLALAGCSKTNTRTAPTTVQAAPVKPLYAATTVRPFSHESQQDTLRVAIMGESLITGNVYVQITDHSGKSIYSTTFPARTLLTYQGPINPKQDEAAIKARIDDFFGSAHFTTPATIQINSPNVADSIKASWRTVETDHTAVCFSYQTGQNSLNQIAYSKSLQKVVSLSRADG